MKKYKYEYYWYSQKYGEESTVWIVDDDVYINVFCNFISWSSMVLNLQNKWCPQQILCVWRQSSVAELSIKDYKFWTRWETFTFLFCFCFILVKLTAC